MEILSLRYFLSLAECLNFSEAADICNISQSSLSKAIIRLENELGVQLFDRSHHPITMTPAGQSFYISLSGLRPQYEEAIDRLRKYKGLKTIHCHFVPNMYAVRNAVRKFSENNKDIELVLSTSSDYLTELDEMTNRNCEFGIMHQPYEIPDGFTSTFLYNDPIYLVMSETSPAAKEDYIPLEKMKRYSFFESHYSTSLLRSLMKEFNFTPMEVFSLPKGLSVREEALFMIAKYAQMGIPAVGVYFSRDLSLYNLAKMGLVQRHLDEIQNIPMVLIEQSNKTKDEYHQRFRNFIVKELEDYAAPVI
jgi:DNA-binding transcriptional LysR family regulator